MAHFCREAAIARGVLHGARRGHAWTDSEIWDPITRQVERMEEHDIKLRAESARRRRLGADRAPDPAQRSPETGEAPSPGGAGGLDAMSTPPQQPGQPPPQWQQPPQPPPDRGRSPWGVVLLAVVALGVGVGAGVLIANSGDEGTKTVTKANPGTTSNKTDVTVSVPTTTSTVTTTVEKTVTVTTPSTPGGTDTAAP